MSVNHYENFPVASVLCPPALRPAVAAIYHFARTADDIADEGDATAAERLADLAAYRDDLRAISSHGAVSPRWAHVFGPLRTAVDDHALPVALLADLLSAFEQDVTKHSYTDRAELLDYCRRSANPVGRLLLHLYGVDSANALRQSDAICTALQLANFWQDLGVDTRRGRQYVPASDRNRHAGDIRAQVADMVGWTRELMYAGAPLVHAVPGRAGWELRLVVQGGLRILDKIEALGFDTLTTRPRLRAFDAPLLLWRALWMRPADTAVARETA
ncbi:MAG: squalene synthase HpnC [Burkholderiales bacterium]